MSIYCASKSTMSFDEQREKEISNQEDTINPPSVSLWETVDVKKWMKTNNLNEYIDKFCTENEIDGLTLLLMKEDDLKNQPLSIVTLRDVKRLWYHIRLLQCSEVNFYNLLSIPNEKFSNTLISSSKTDLAQNAQHNKENHSTLIPSNFLDTKTHSTHSIRRTKSNQNVYCTMCGGEKQKTFFSFVYAFLSCLWTSYIMAVVHDRVPDTTKSVLLRRFFALTGTIFFLRSITMLVTSLSVPGPHLECTPFTYGTFHERFTRGLEIFLLQGLSIKGVRTCGDYMFSGHTVILTLLNHCITEYTTSDFYVIHLMSWICNIFGMFLILAAHEHYSIDVFIAFFLTSRLFLYYHSLANNLALTQNDTRLSIWFPMFSYFEKNVKCIIPNVFRIPYPFSKLISSENITEENDGDENNKRTGSEVNERTLSHSDKYCNNPNCCTRKTK
ncbi:unnamed protein product [Didymodactylos carnosus]|uniref:SAM domain-containing protein n=1 Tax=Didymodactylos carnosus TaxID=1234261 RepID=A0A8S2HT88_9BILA|nr:unnamed protein product [Didymodactylos carnosus]CAF3664911.1 unnamed protein product [Didymodactylos carnosus]